MPIQREEDGAISFEIQGRPDAREERAADFV